MDYKPGLVAASLNQGKTKKKVEGSNPILANLFTAKKGKVTKKKSGNKETKTAIELPKKIQNGIKSDVNVSIGIEKIGTKRKNEVPDTIPTKKAKKTKKAKTDVNESIDINKIGTKGKNEAPDMTPTKKAKKAKKAKTDDNVAVDVEKVGAKRKNETPDTTPTNKPKKTKKAKKDSDFPFVHESLLTKSPTQQQKSKTSKNKIDKDDEEKGLSRRMKRRDKTTDNRTLFIGNCPLSADKKVMTKLFKDFGPIESVRFRCGPAAKLDVPRRAIIIKKEFHENASSYVCYIVFKDEESAQKAVQLNGHVLDGLHLRVDVASNNKKHDKKRSIFVGNLPFSASEENLRTHFQDCGVVTNVRVIRDRETSIGKGFGYVQFETKDGVTLAKKLNETELDGRKLRVMTCTNKPVKKTDQSKGSNTTPSKPTANPEKKRMSFAPSNRPKSNKSFQEILQAKKEKRLKKMKKKRQGVQKSDGLSSIFGDMPKQMKQLKEDNPKLKTKDKKNGKKSDKKGGKKSDKKGGKKSDKKDKKMKPSRG